METDCRETENNFEREEILPDDVVTMSIKTEPEVIDQDEEKSGIHGILKEIAQSQRQLNIRIEKLAQNQIRILTNLRVLTNGQKDIVSKQQTIVDKMEKLESSIVLKPEMMAHSKLLMECKVATQRVEESVSRMTGENHDAIVDEVASMLPLQSLPAVRDLEEHLESPEFAQATVTYMHKLRGTSEDVSSIIRGIFTDELLELYNWEGRWEKQSLAKLTLFNKTLRDVFQNQGPLEFEKSVRKAIERSHHRANQKKYLKKEKYSIFPI